MSRVEITYNPKLSIAENAKLANVSVNAVKKYMQSKKISGRLNACEYRLELLENSIGLLQEQGENITVKKLCDLTHWSNKTVIKYLKVLDDKDVYLATISTPKKVSMFTLSTNERVIKAVSANEHTILANILKLYNNSKPVEADLTYSKGVIWKNLPQPNRKFDLYPLSNEVEHLTVAENLSTGIFSSVLFELPFIVRIEGASDTSIISRRFESFQSKKELLDTNTKMLHLSHKLLNRKGILIIKTGDCIYSGIQIFTHVHLINEASCIGFEIEDLFILTRKNVILSSNAKQIRHARKNYCYYLVLRKK